MLFVAIILLLLAALPALLTVRNLGPFQQLPDVLPGAEAVPGDDWVLPRVSVLIPARDEASGIADAIESVLASQGVELEVVVMDDHSSDQTVSIVTEIAERDRRVRLVHAPELPDGWNGKQHACQRLSEAATYDLLLFMDADVRLRSDGLGRMVARLQATPDVELLSGFPYQQTVTISEKMLIPMMYFVLLGYLPLDQMRSSAKPEFGAGCGQLFLAKRPAYVASGGHASIKASRHDGLKLPRSFRESGYLTDLVDASQIASVRMYTSWAEVRAGVLKNANEGIARSPLIYFFTILLLGGSVLPLLFFAHALFWQWPLAATVLLGLASLLSFLPRALIAFRLKQSLVGAVLHPLAVTWFVAMQWIAFLRDRVGAKAIAWRGRS